LTGSWLLNLCEPPEEFRFVRGVLLAYDVDWPFVTDVIAPALTGVVGGDRNATYRTARAIEGAELLVLGCAGRATLGPLHTWARFASVYGRTQHAKVGILQYQREGGLTTKTRAYVASSNLTRSGILRNREVFVVDEITGQTRRDSLVIDVFDALGALSEASALAAPDSADLAAMLKKMRAATSSNSKAGRQLVHSIGAERALLRRIVPPASRTTKRIVIVSPGHSVNGVALAQHLKDIGLLTDRPRVDIYTGLDGPGQGPVFSPSFIDDLRRRGMTVELRGVPGLEVVDGHPRSRPLHAKLVATVDDREDVRSLVGSANCSPTGWLGRNREVMVAQEGKADDLERLIAELGAGRKGFDPVAPLPEPAWGGSGGNPPAGLPILGSLRRQGDALMGTVDLAPLWKDGSKPVSIRLGAERVTVSELARGVRIPERNAVVEVTVQHGDGAKQTFLFQLGGGMPEEHPHLWRADPDDPPERTDAWFLALFGDLLAASFAGTHGGGKEGKLSPSSGGDDAYRVPFERRLALIARHHRESGQLVPPDELARAINEYLEGDERLVALSLFTNQPAADGTLLPALNDVAAGRV
jgi:hypothetical protein